MNKSSINQVIQNLKKEQMVHEEKIMKHKTEADKLSQVVLTLEELTGAKQPVQTDFVKIVGESQSKPVAVKGKGSFELPWDKRVKKKLAEFKKGYKKRGPGPIKGVKRGPYKKGKYKNTDLNLTKKVPAPVKKYKIQWGKEIKGLMMNQGELTRAQIQENLVSKYGKNLITRNEKRIKVALSMMVYLKVAKMNDNIDPKLVSYSIK